MTPEDLHKVILECGETVTELMRENEKLRANVGTLLRGRHRMADDVVILMDALGGSKDECETQGTKSRTAQAQPGAPQAT